MTGTVFLNSRPYHSEAAVAPILLDNRSLLKLGLSLLLLTIIVFGGGFITGYQKAVHQQIAMRTQNLALPVSLAAPVDELAPQVPARLSAGADIDVDSPDSASDPHALDLEYHKPDTKTVEADVMTPSPASKSTAPPVTSVVAVARQAGGTSKPVQPAEDAMQKLPGEQASAADHKTPASATSAKAFAAEKNAGRSAEINRQNARYSIQVGMYGRRLNAENLVKLLGVQGLDAYLAEYTNKNRQTRYNVRIGYFENKQEALAALKQYRKQQDGKGGYLVKLERSLHAENEALGDDTRGDKTAEF